jgi:two-component system CheB/CheR fusion protein
MNEELESTNTELQTINTELQQRSMQLDHVNTFLQSIMANMQLGVAVVDKDLKIQLWNRRAEDLWGVRSDEAVGQPLLALDIGLPMARGARGFRRSSDARGASHEPAWEAFHLPHPGGRHDGGKR